MAEITMFGAGGDDEMVVRNATSLRDHFLTGGIDTGDVRQDHMCILLPTEDAANRRCDVRRRQAGGRHLIEQRLE